MHKNFFKIKAAISCNKNFSNSLGELKPFLSFDLGEISSEKGPNSINSEYHVLIVDSTSCEKFPFEKINIPKILIIGSSEKNILRDKFNFVIKLPLSIIQFNRTIVDLSQSHQFEQNSLVKIKDYELDKNTRFLKREKRSMKITEKEMHFIEELNNSSKPLTKNHILENIWGYSSDTDTHTVETHIYRLRQKIKSKFNDENFIKHTKEGYSF